MHHSELDKFNLKAIVLHDPEDAKTFRMLKNDFYQLSYDTGDKFLFVTFFSLDNRRKPHSYRFSREQVAFDSDFPAEQIYLLRQQLDLDHIPLPIILLTADVDSDKIQVIQLRGDDIPHALLELSRRVPSIENDIDNTQFLLSRGFAYTPNIFTKQLDLPLADILTSFFAKEVIKESDHNPLLKDSLGKWSEADERKLKNELEAERKKDAPNPERYDRILLKLNEDRTTWNHLKAGCRCEMMCCNDEVQSQEPSYGRMSTHFLQCRTNELRSNHSRNPLEDIDDNLLDNIENESLTAFRTARRFLSAMSEQSDDDYAGIALYLSKIIEIELNTSIVQEMRKQLGIEMPAYYCKYKDCNQPFVIRDDERGKEFNLNARKDGVWKRLELGTFHGAYSQMIRMNTAYSTFEPLAYEFKEALYRFYNRRNGPTHYEVMNYEEFKEQCDDFNFLLRFFPELMRRKTAVKANTPNRGLEWK